MKSSFVDYIVDLLLPYGHITVKGMFGGYGIYCNAIIFAIIVDDDLFFKTNKLLSKEFEAEGSYPFTYNARGKTIALSYYKVPIEVIEDEAQLRSWFKKSYAVANIKK